MQPDASPDTVDDIALFAAVFAPAALIDHIAGGDAVNARGMLSAAGLGVGAGVFAGTIAGVALRAIARSGRRLSVVIWILIGGVIAAFLSFALGVPARLGGRNTDLALIALAGSVTVGLGLAAAGLASQPRPGQPRGWLATLRLPLRAPLGAVLAVGAAAAIWIDRAIQPDGYMIAHETLRWTTIAALFVALRAAPGQARLPRAPRAARWAAIVAGAALMALPIIALRPRHRHEVRAILDRPFPGLALRLLRYFGDPDLDGYSAILGGGDCDSLNAAVHPSAREIPGNGIDDNCLLGDAPVPPPEREPQAVLIPSAASPLSVVLITIDTVVASRMSLYGAARRTTPKLHGLSFSGATFERAYTAGGWTSLTISSMLRGLYPRELRWTRVYETRRMRLVRTGEIEDEGIRMMFGLPLEDTHPTLPAWLRRRGMYTAAVVDDGQSEFLDPKLGTGAGFDEIVDMDTVPHGGGDDATTTDTALRVLHKIPADRPFFLWVHYFGPHSPSTVHDGIERFGDSEEDRYDHELLYMDHHVTRLIRELRKLAGTRRSLAVLLASDHGEVFHLRNRNHGSDLREQLLRVPMILWAPNVRPGRYAGLVSTIDLMPTVLALTETPAPRGLEGVDIRRIIENDPTIGHRVLITDTWRFRSSGRMDRDAVAAFDGERKLTWNLLDEGQSLRTQEPGGRDGDELIGTTDAGDLRRVLEAYIERYGAIDLND